ncbi:unnamed protein product, partial [Symbiodinium sp. CCMP2456]
AAPGDCRISINPVPRRFGAPRHRGVEAPCAVADSSGGGVAGFRLCADRPIGSTGTDITRGFCRLRALPKRDWDCCGHGPGLRQCHALGGHGHADGEGRPSGGAHGVDRPPRTAPAAQSRGGGGARSIRCAARGALRCRADTTEAQ